MAAIDPNDGVRLDKWLWAARFFKTRALAAAAIGKGQVGVNGQPAKASRELRAGDRVALRQGGVVRTIVVAASSRSRGPATVAQALYAETAESVAAREAHVAERRLAPDPASAISGGAPSKRDRRRLAQWNRWSASAEPD